ncbi:GTP-binding protein 10-like isoform X2 [Ptychodera flava]|uniref:GTP-binding protein 10-like isoform X2 n=1 Tax=Ptychodera flava TaxID=63121 RepID=UPI00396AA21E
MVFLTRILLKKTSKDVSSVIRKRFGNFQDTLRIYVKGGSGGMGLPSYGGQGGNGGDVIVVASPKMTLRKVSLSHPSKRFSAGTGVNSRVRRLQGIRGADTVITVPVGVTVVTDDGQILADLNEANQRVVVAKGGQGGCFRTDWNGMRGERKSVKLDLKLIADVGFVGFPNAGKSTLLGALSRSEPKIADYPFTTVKPQIGVMHYSDRRQISLADLPGLIEGAHLNRGMGHRFLKHVERTKLLLFVVDINGFQLSDKWLYRSALDTVALLNSELELYKPELVSKPCVLAINKLDTEGADEKLGKVMEKFEEEDYYSDLAEDIAPSVPVKFRDIFPISAKEGTGLEPLKSKIRVILDEEAERERQRDRQEQQKHAASEER